MLTKRCFTHPMLIMAVYTGCIFIFNDFNIRSLVQMLVFITLLFISMLYSCRTNLSLKIYLDSIKLSFVFMAGFLFITLFRPDSTQNETNLFYIATVAICACMLCLENLDAKCSERIINVLLFFSISLALFTLFFYWNQNLHRMIIYPLLKAKSKVYFDLAIQEGYGIPVGGVTFSSYFFVVGLAIAYGMMMTKKGSSALSFFKLFILEVLFVFALIVMGRKGELISACLALLSLWSVNFLIRKSKPKRISLLITCITILTGLFCLPGLLSSGYMQRYVEMFLHLRSGGDFTGGRVILWKWGWELFKEHPVFGGGLGAYYNYIPDNYRISAVGSTIIGPHIVYLQFLCEFGITGFVFLMTPIIYTLVKTLQQYCQLRKRRENGLLLCMSSISLFLQIFFLFLFFFDQTFSLSHFWLFYCLTFYFASASLSNKRSSYSNSFLIYRKGIYHEKNSLS